MAVSQMIGAKIHRREDPRLVSGHGHYVDDFNQPGQVYASFIRSPYAHAKITSIDLTEATAAKGVVAVYTAKDFQGQIAGTHPTVAGFAAEKKTVPERFPIVSGEVTYQGEIVAVIVADSSYGADDAANLVNVEYEVLPAVMDLDEALKADSPKAHNRPGRQPRLGHHDGSLGGYGGRLQLGGSRRQGAHSPAAPGSHLDGDQGHPGRL